MASIMSMTSGLEPARLGHPVFVYQPVDVGMAAGNGPENRRRGVARLVRRGKDVLYADNIGKPLPAVLLAVKREGIVAHHARFFGVATGHHRDVCGVCNAGVDRFHLFCARAAGKILLKVGAGGEIFKVFADKCINRKDQQTSFFVFLHGYSP